MTAVLVRKIGQQEKMACSTRTAVDHQLISSSYCLSQTGCKVELRLNRRRRSNSPNSWLGVPFAHPPEVCQVDPDGQADFIRGRRREREEGFREVYCICVKDSMGGSCFLSTLNRRSLSGSHVGVEFSVEVTIHHGVLFIRL